MGIDLTFYVWGDTHFGYEMKFGDDDLRGEIIKQMNSLVGWPFPAELGGRVNRPEFVVLCGDAIDGNPSESQLEFDYYRYFMKMLNYPYYEVLGNHDKTEPYLGYFIHKYGGKSYTFNRQGIHFIVLNSEYDELEQGSVSSDDLGWLEDDLQTLTNDIPVVLFLHTRIDSLKNSDDVLKIIAKRQVILVMSGHTHIPDVFELDGISCISVGHCRNHPIDPEYGRNFYVVHIQDRRIIALPWRWDLKDWERGQRWAGWCSPANVSGRWLLLDKKF